MKVLVLGIGNSILSDEGVGIHVIEALTQTPLATQDDVELLDGGTLSFTLAGPIQDADALIVVDAAQLKSAPGTLQVFQGEAMDTFLMNNRRSSVHEVGLTDLRAIAMLAGHWPERRAMVAIQPQKLDWGEYPTDAVAAAIPVACAHIESIIGAWRNGS
ncbi:MAG: HyaD/HybD family hydrogenase maturation endopeptidase [Hydrogenophilales bacterium]|nr:HyaD/HybD family hydrogenase maturation endopeptidase [Hydrogenophilales bacterium]